MQENEKRKREKESTLGIKCNRIMHGKYTWVITIELKNGLSAQF